MRRTDLDRFEGIVNDVMKERKRFLINQRNSFMKPTLIFAWLIMAILGIVIYIGVPLIVVYGTILILRSFGII